MSFFYIARVNNTPAAVLVLPAAQLVAADKHLGLDPGHNVALVALMTLSWQVRVKSPVSSFLECNSPRCEVMWVLAKLIL